MRKLLLLVVSLVMVVLAYPLWKPAATKSKWFIVADNIGHDLLRRTHLRGDQMGGEPQAIYNPAQLKRIDDTFNSYLKNTGLTRDTLKGKTVLEIGPGDYVGVALKFLAAGAQEVVCIEKFVHFQETAAHLQTYRALRDSLGPEDRERFDQVANLDSSIKIDPKRLKYIYGQGIEDTDTLFPPAYFDAIVSTSVLEEIYPIDDAFAKMNRLLRSGGYSIHKIDFRDYGMFTKHGFHPLEFLTVPDWAYRYMTESSGQPNRRMVNYYRDKMAELGYESKMCIAMAAGQPDMPECKYQLVKGVDYPEASLAFYQSIRPRLLERYKAMSGEDLITETIFLIARKPAEARVSARRSN